MKICIKKKKCWKDPSASQQQHSLADRITHMPTAAASVTSPTSSTHHLNSSSNASDSVGYHVDRSSQPPVLTSPPINSQQATPQQRRPVSIIRIKPPIGSPPPLPTTTSTRSSLATPTSPVSPSPVAIKHQSSTESRISQVVQSPSPTSQPPPAYSPSQAPDFRQESYNIAISTEKPRTTENPNVPNSSRYNTLPAGKLPKF